MKIRNSQWRVRVTIGLALITTLGCNILSGSGPDSNPIPSPTPTDSFVMGQDSISSRCNDLSGTLEFQVLVGPSDAVGLDPVAIGEIPFSVLDNGDSFSVQGGGALTYHEVLEEEWGTFTVNFDMDTQINGTCVDAEGSGQLNLNLIASGDQMVEVRSEGFQGDYPWSGTHEFDLNFPLEEGSQREGEGWVLVLHLKE
jgi:hypothetical protein